MSEKLTPTFELLLDGSPVDAAIAESVIAVRVQQHLELADAIEVTLSNDDLAWTESDAFVEGKQLALKLGYVEQGDKVLVATGEIVRRDCEFPVRGATVVKVVAFDKEHRLKRGVYSRTFVDMKDSDIVSQIAGEAGLSADVEATTVTHRYVFQNAQTNLSFIRERAMRLNYEIDVDEANGKLTFKKAVEGGAVATLEWGKNLLSFNARMTTDQQVSKVIVRGWDMTQKVKIEGTADQAKIRYVLDASDKGAKLAEAAHKTREILFVDRPIFETAEATALAEARLNQHSLRYTEGEAVCQGDPNIGAGTVVEILALGVRASGQYYVSSVVHHFEPAVGYSTHLSFVRAAERKAAEAPKKPPEQLPDRQQEMDAPPSWVEIRARSYTGESLEGISYKVTLPNGSTQTGVLGPDQNIRVEGIRDPGEAQVELNPPEDLETVG